MRQRDTRECRRGDCRCDAWTDDFELHAGLRQRLRLFAAAAEDKRIAAFDPHNPMPLARALDQHPVDLSLIDDPPPPLFLPA